MRIIEDKWFGTERRKSRRLDVASRNIVIPVNYSIIGTEDYGRFYIAKNISSRGICLIADQNIEVDTVFTLKINLPNYHIPIQTSGRVLWNKEHVFSNMDREKKYYDVGFKFIEISKDDRNIILQFLESNFN